MSVSKDIVQTILQGFDNHFSKFSEITEGAQQRFEKAGWKAERKYSRLRIQFYDTRVNEAIKKLNEGFVIQPLLKIIGQK